MVRDRKLFYSLVITEHDRDSRFVYSVRPLGTPAISKTFELLHGHLYVQHTRGSLVTFPLELDRFGVIRRVNPDSCVLMIILYSAAAAEVDMPYFISTFLVRCRKA